MNMWIITAIIAGLLIIAGVAVVLNAQTAQATQPTTIKCSGCQNGCTADKNCGSATCGAVSGGTCGCGK